MPQPNDDALLNTVTLKAADDWHIHLRDGAALARTVNDAAAHFQRVIVMPNLAEPVTTTAKALAYRERIMAALAIEAPHFNPLMTLYLTETTTVKDIEQAAACEHVHAVKLYPAGATTLSSHGVRNWRACKPVLAAMQTHNMPLLIHGEVTDKSIDVFDKEAVFIERELTELRQTYPTLRIVLEHITTADAVHFVENNDHTAATITAHHLLLNRNAMFDGGIRPHHFCLPVLKRQRHQHALICAATSGNPSFFLGTDSAPHNRFSKESSCGCAGIYTAFAPLSYYAQAFEQAQALDKLDAFASEHGARFYRLPVTKQVITLIRKPWTMPEQLSYLQDPSKSPEHPINIIKPLGAGEVFNWQRASLAS